MEPGGFGVRDIASQGLWSRLVGGKTGGSFHSQVTSDATQKRNLTGVTGCQKSTTGM